MALYSQFTIENFKKLNKIESNHQHQSKSIEIAVNGIE